MRLVLFGSGEFGLPAFQYLARDHEIMLVVSQPDRPSGRGRQLKPNPVAAWAREAAIPLLASADVNEAGALTAIRSVDVDAWVIIAFGQKLSPQLLEARFAINLHASLLPRFRGAAPINWAMIEGDDVTGLSVITLSDRIDAGDILGTCSTPIDPSETAGELHDRLAALGPGLVQDVLAAHEQDRVQAIAQDPGKAVAARKLHRSDGTVDFNQPATSVRNRIHGLTPWPGCDIEFDGRPLRLLRSRVLDADEQHDAPGRLLPSCAISCRPGSLQLLEVQPPGGRSMNFEDWLRGCYQGQSPPVDVEIRPT